MKYIVFIIACFILIYSIMLMRSYHIAKCAYAHWMIGEAVVRYLEDNNNLWPNRMGELKRYYYGGMSDFPEAKELIQIELNVNLQEIDCDEHMIRNLFPVSFINHNNDSYLYENSNGNDVIQSYLLSICSKEP